MGHFVSSRYSNDGYFTTPYQGTRCLQIDNVGVLLRALRPNSYIRWPVRPYYICVRICEM
jgi:hypothetical protein